MTTPQHPQLLSLGVALPKNLITRDHYLDFIRQQSMTEKHRQLLERVISKSTIDSRYSILIARDESGTVLPFLNGNPGVQARMEEFERLIPDLAEAAARACLSPLNIDPKTITHLVGVSCTGFSAPGWDIALMERLGIPETVERTHVGFMGCHGAVNGLRVAGALAQTSPEALVLLVCAESCSLHYQTEEQAIYVPNILFGDGAAAVLMSGTSQGQNPSLLATGSRVFAEHKTQMTWRITDHGFRMTLENSVPQLIQKNLAETVDAFLQGHNMERSMIRNWAIHPGGPKIVDACAVALELSDTDLHASREVLRTIGNVSSPTLLFVLEALWQKPGPTMMIAFGPGLTVEMAVIS